MQAKWVKLLGNANFMERMGAVVFIKRKYRRDLIDHVVFEANCFRTVTFRTFSWKQIWSKHVSFHVRLALPLHKRRKSSVACRNSILFTMWVVARLRTEQTKKKEFNSHWWKNASNFKDEIFRNRQKRETSPKMGLF